MLSGLVAAVTGVAVLAPGMQDGVHAVYVPVAVLAGAVLLRKRYPRGGDDRSQPAAGR